MIDYLGVAFGALALLGSILIPLIKGGSKQSDALRDQADKALGRSIDELKIKVAKIEQSADTLRDEVKNCVTLYTQVLSDIKHMEETIILKQEYKFSELCNQIGSLAESVKTMREMQDQSAKMFTEFMQMKGHN